MMPHDSSMTLHRLVLLLALLTTHTSAQTANCSCSFTVPVDEEAGCRVYGQLGNDILIPYFRASQDCLDEFNIRVRALDADQVETMCGPPISVSSLQQFVRFDSSSAANALKSQLSPEYFDSNADGSVYTLRQNITASDGSMIDCTTSSSDCWSEINSYLSDNTDLLQTMCDELYARLYTGYELEQSTVRIALCNADATTACTELKNQIDSILASDSAPNDCSAFGLGPAENDIPEACVANATLVTDDALADDDTVTDDNNGDDATDDANGDDTSKEVSKASTRLRWSMVSVLATIILGAVAC